MGDYQNRADKILQQVNELAAVSDAEGMISRIYGTDAFIEAGNKIIAWMQEAGLETRTDNVHNIRGRLNCHRANAGTLVMASHFDTVVNAGKFDGPLGILTGLDIIGHLIKNKAGLPFNIELVAFCDEEGVRFHTTYLGSQVMAGSFNRDLLNKTDNAGISLGSVIR